MQAIPMVVMAVAAVASTVGTVMSGRAQASAQKTAAIREQQLQEANAQMMEKNAAQAEESARTEEKSFRVAAARALAAERAAGGASGVMAEGTPLLTYYENMKQYEEDALRIRQGGNVEKTGWLQRASLARAYGQHYLESGEEAASATQTKTIFGAGSTLLGGAADFFKAGSKTYGWGK